MPRMCDDENGITIHDNRELKLLTGVVGVSDGYGHDYQVD